MANINFKIIAFFCASAIIFNFNHPLSADEGAVLNGAWQIAHNKIPYVDFFTFVAPASFYFVKWTQDLLGYSYFSVKLISVLLLLISCHSVYKITKYLTQIESVALASSWIWLMVASSLIFLPIINYNTYSTITSIFALFFLTKAIKFGTWLNFFLTGLMLGATIVTLQHKGIILFIAVAPVLFTYTLQRKIAFSKFITMITATTLLPLIAASYWGPKTLLENLILWPLKHDIPFNPIPLTNFIFILLVFIALVIYTRTDKNVNRKILTIMTIAQIALLLSIFSRRDAGHFLMNSFPFIVVLTYCAYQLYLKFNLQRYKNLIRINLAIFVASIFIVFTLMNLTTNKFYKDFRKTVDSLQINELYAHPYLPQMYYELKLPNPYRYDILYTGIHPPDYFIDNLTTLLLQDPQFIIASYDVIPKFNYTKDNPLDIYILSHYSTKVILDNLIFLEKTKWKQN